MQQSPHEIKEKLLNSLDHEYNVVDMAAVLEVITALEKANITKEALERTRIGKYINELRKRTNNEQLARRAKDLVKSWRRLLPQTQERVNGEETVFPNSISSPGNMTVLGPGPGPGFGPGPGPGNRTQKMCSSVPGTPRYKASSPSIIIERSSSPYFSSASNSPLLNSSVFQGSNSSPMPSNYAPVKVVGCQLHARSDSNSLNTNYLSNQSKNMTYSQIVMPLSPSAHRENSNITTSDMCTSLPLPRTFSNVSPGLKSNSSSVSPSMNASQNMCSKSVSPTLAFSVHSSLDLAKTNAANKRLRKENSYSNCSSPEVITLDDSPVGNGTSEVTDNISPSESSAFVSTTLCNSNSVEDDKTIASSLKTPKRKRSFDKNELHENRLGDMLASLPSGSKHPKVKTTQQLIADLQAKKGLNTALSPNSITTIDTLNCSEAEVSRTKSELLKKFLISSQSVTSENNHESPVNDSSVSISSDYDSHHVSDVPSVINTSLEVSSSISYPDPVDEEIKSILSALPPINLAEIDVEEDYSSPNQPTSLTDDLNKLETTWEFVNGVYDCHGNWKSWQECAEQRSYQGESFQIMPYVNID